MKIKEPLYPVLSLALIGVLAAFLTYWRSHQQLGKPGIVVSQVGDGPELEIGFPGTVLNYTSEVREIEQGTIDALPSDTTINARLYRLPSGFDMQLMGVLMGIDRTSIHQPEFCLTGAGFKIKESWQDTIPIGGDEPYDLPVMVLKSDKELVNALGQKEVYTGFYIYWFVADDHATPYHWERMWWMAKGLFTSGELQRWAYISCFTVCDPTYEEWTMKSMKSFLSAAVPVFQPRPSILGKVEIREAAEEEASGNALEAGREAEAGSP